MGRDAAGDGRPRAIDLKEGVVGGFRFDRHGDMTPARITILRVRPGRPRDEGGDYGGAELDRVVTVPTDLAG